MSDNKQPIKLTILIALSVILLASCRKEYSCESCIPIPLKIDTLQIYPSMQHLQGTTTTYFTIYFSDTVKADITVVRQYTINGTDYNLTGTVLRGDIDTTILIGWLPLTWDANIPSKTISCTPFQGDGWYIKH